MKKISNNIKGILYILLAMFILAIQDICIKLLSSDVNLFEIFFFRSVIGLIIILFFLKFTNRKIILKTHYIVYICIYIYIYI